jgi:predicted  nucleic acid-binding Zn-ribbon protein
MSNDRTHAQRQARYRDRQRARLIELEKELAKTKKQVAGLKAQLAKLRAKDDDHAA